MPLFPEIDLSQLVERAAQNGMPGLPPTDPHGVLGGLNESLIKLLGNFSPGDLGVCVIDEKLQLTLPVPDWSEYAFNSRSLVSYTAGLTGLTTVWTVPADERNYLVSINAQRSGGDNTISHIAIESPGADGGYWAGDPNNYILQATAAIWLFWPDNAATQAGISQLSPSQGKGWLMEPGTNIRLYQSGAGVGAGNWLSSIHLIRTKLTQAQTP